MIDYLLHFDDEAAATAALADHYGEYEWAGEFLPVALVTADVVYGEPDAEGSQAIISERETLPGFWLLTTQPEQDGQVAEVERETARILTGGSGMVGARLDPVWAGAAAIPLWEDD